MRVLAPPPDSQKSALNLCLAATKNKDLHARLSAASGSLLAAENDYKKLASSASLHKMPRVSGVLSVKSTELNGLYTTHFSKKTGSARAIYDRIKSSAPNAICPLCGVGVVAQLDHHLPKAHYPDLSILPINLVPACNSCNDKKRASYPMSPEEQSIHPYFDSHLIQDVWVRAELICGAPLTVIYSSSPPSSWLALDKDRVRRHFEVCGIARVYAANAANELVYIRDRLTRISENGGVYGVQVHLQEECSIHSCHRNSWKYALYRELASNTWFVSGGYLSISS